MLQTGTENFRPLKIGNLVAGRLEILPKEALERYCAPMSYKREAFFKVFNGDLKKKPLFLCYTGSKSCVYYISKIITHNIEYQTMSTQSALFGLKQNVLKNKQGCC